MRIRIGLGLGTIAALTLVGCASVPPMPPAGSTGAPAAHDTTRSGGSSPTAAATPGRAPADSMPSAAALGVLATIPEPLKPEERVPPPANARPDSAAESDTSSEVPVPEPTQPLGERPGAAAGAGAATGVANPSVGTIEPPPSGSLPAQGSTPPPTTSPQGAAGAGPAAPDTCWRVQVAAPTERPKADGLRSAAQSQLLIPMVVEHEGKLYKVRTRDCLDASASDLLKQRAIGAGFAGSFRFAGKKP
jgi:hypothetical protein